jgi:hypothetical protein
MGKENLKWELKHSLNDYSAGQERIQSKRTATAGIKAETDKGQNWFAWTAAPLFFLKSENRNFSRCAV